VLFRRAAAHLLDLLDEFIGQSGISIAPVTEEQARLSREAFRLYGQGSGHRAALTSAIVLRTHLLKS
jgi:ribonuclease VapC